MDVPYISGKHSKVGCFASLWLLITVMVRRRISCSLCSFRQNLFRKLVWVSKNTLHSLGQAFQQLSQDCNWGRDIIKQLQQVDDAGDYHYTNRTWHERFCHAAALCGLGHYHAPTARVKLVVHADPCSKVSALSGHKMSISRRRSGHEIRPSGILSGNHWRAPATDPVQHMSLAAALTSAQRPGGAKRGGTTRQQRPRAECK